MSGAESGALANLHPLAAELRALQTLWPQLDPDVRAAMLRMAMAARRAGW